MREANKSMPCRLAAVCAGWLLCAAALAQGTVSVSGCPGQASLPVAFEVDCSHVADPGTRALCKPFAENQACKVFPAYRKITGIDLEQYCPSFKYTIYDKDKWPHAGGEAGGYAGRCGAELMADYSVLIKSEVGPYDVHEILHVYQQALGALPYSHVLFGTSMARARHEIGDRKGYWDAMTSLKTTLRAAAAGADANAANTSVPPEKRCVPAESHTEIDLYLKDPRNVELFYRKLERGRLKDMADRQARFNRMLDLVSGGKAKRYLLSHGCPPF
jgi:hypothetical protein